MGKKRGQQAERIALPDVEVDENYEKPDVEAILEWPLEEAETLVGPTIQQCEGVVDIYDPITGGGLIKCSSADEDIPFFRMGVPVKNRPKGALLDGSKVAFSYYKNQGMSYATGLRF